MVHQKRAHGSPLFHQPYAAYSRPPEGWRSGHRLDGLLHQGFFSKGEEDSPKSGSLFLKFLSHWLCHCHRWAGDSFPCPGSAPAPTPGP